MSIEKCHVKKATPMKYAKQIVYDDVPKALVI